MFIGTSVSAFCAGITAMMMVATGSVVEATDWTEMFIPYNDDGADSPGQGYPYSRDDPLRQHLHIFQAPSLNNIPTPVYFNSHGNSGRASGLSKYQMDIFANAGYSIISWESVTTIASIEDIEVCWSDFTVVWEWFQANAVLRNLDPESVVIGGRSRGSVCSWPMAHSQKPAIRGFYMYNALPGASLEEPSPGVPSPLLEVVTAGSPPGYLAYGPECPKPILQDCAPSPKPGDIHNPRYGQIIVDRYTELGMAAMIQLTDGLTNAEMDIFDLFPVFAASLDDDDDNDDEDDNDDDPDDDPFMVYVPLPNSTTPGGHCMDGSMAGYYIRVGTDPNLFVIQLKGGGSCTTQKECQNRANTHLGSSTTYATTKKKGDSFLSADCNENPLFCNASAVHIPYCSGDAHMGTAAKSDESWGYYFEGHLNFKAITEHLISENGLNDTNAEMKVLLTGGSAGARGAFANVDGLQERLSLATVKAAPDAGWSEPSALADDLPSLFSPSSYTNFAAGEHGNDFYDLIQSGEELVDVWKTQEGNALSADCLERYVNETDNLWWACISMERAYQYIEAPIFNIHTLYDSLQIFNKGGAPEDIVDPLEADTTREYIDMYGKAVVLSLDKLLNNKTDIVKAHPDGLFAASCLTHGTAKDVTIEGGHNKIDIVGDWFFQLGELTEYHRQIEQCADTEDLQLPCNPAKKCQFKFPSPLVEACTREITNAGCLNSPNKNKCNRCVKENKDVIQKGGCKSKDQKNLKRVAQEICELQYVVVPLPKVHIDKVVVRSSAKGTKWKPQLTFKIADSETNQKVKDAKFTILMSYGKKIRQKSCTSKKNGKCKFKLNKIAFSTASVKIGFLGASGDGVVYDGSNNKNLKGCKVFSEDCLTFDILAPVQ